MGEGGEGVLHIFSSPTLNISLLVCFIDFHSYVCTTRCPCFVALFGLIITERKTTEHSDNVQCFHQLDEIFENVYYFLHVCLYITGLYTCVFARCMHFIKL